MPVVIGLFNSTGFRAFIQQEGKQAYEKAADIAGVFRVWTESLKSPSFKLNEVEEEKREKLFADVKKHSGKLLTVTTLVKSFWKFSALITSKIPKIPQPVSVVFNGTKVLKILDAPSLIEKASKIKDVWDGIEFGTKVYFMTHDLRTGADAFVNFGLIPQWELFITAAMGIGNVLAFSNARQKYQTLSDKSQAFSQMSCEEAEKHVKDLMDSERKLWEASFAVIAALAIGGTAFFPQARVLHHSYNLSKGIGALYKLGYSYFY